MPGTQSSEFARWPDSWQKSVEARYRVSIVATGLISLTAFGVAVYYLQVGEHTMARYTVLFAAVCALTSWVGFETRFRRRRSGAQAMSTENCRDELPGLRIPYSRRLYVGLFALMTCISLLFTMATLESAFNESNSAYLWGILAAFFASFPVLVLTRRFALGRIVITPRGLYQRGFTFRSFLPWSGVNMIHPVHTDGPDILITASADTPWDRRQITRLWRQDRLPELRGEDDNSVTPAIRIQGKFLEADPALVLAILTYYAHNPDARSELTTGATLERARVGGFL